MSKTGATEKAERSATLQFIVEELQKLMKRKLGPHMYNIGHQFIQIRHMKRCLRDNEALIHIDFSENWATKLSAEVMSKHFGACKVEVTLHSGVTYLHYQWAKFHIRDHPATL